MSDTVNRPTPGGLFASLWRWLKAFCEGVRTFLITVAVILTSLALLAVLAHLYFNHQKVDDIAIDWNQGQVKLKIRDAQPAHGGTDGDPEPARGKGAPSGTSPAKDARPNEGPGAAAPQPAPDAAEDVLLVFDHSASSYGNDAALFAAAQRGARDFISALRDPPRLSLLLLHSRGVWYPRDFGPGVDRATLAGRIDAQFPDGALALYDGLNDAFDRLRSRASDNAATVVFLTAARADNSRLTAQDLRAKARPRPAVRPVRLYALVLAPGAGAETSEVAGSLKDLAALTGGRFYRTSPDDLRTTAQELARELNSSSPR
jgi:hypothetical protein